MAGCVDFFLIGREIVWGGLNYLFPKSDLDRQHILGVIHNYSTPIYTTERLTQLMLPSTSLTSTNFDQIWIGLKVHVTTLEKNTVEWTLDQKIYERERTSDHHGREARAIFRCTAADEQEGIIKVRML